MTGSSPSDLDVEIALMLLQLVALLLPVAAILIQATINLILSREVEMTTTVKSMIGIFFFGASILLISSVSHSIQVLEEAGASSSIILSLTYLEAGIIYLTLTVLVLIVAMVGVDRLIGKESLKIYNRIRKATEGNEEEGTGEDTIIDEPRTPWEDD